MHFLVFSQILPNVKVGYLLAVPLLPLQSWQGLPRTAQRGHLSPMAICVQVLLIRPFSNHYYSLCYLIRIDQLVSLPWQLEIARRYSVNKKQITKDITFVVLTQILLCSCSPALACFDVCVHRCVPERVFHCQTVYLHYSWPK